MLPRTDGDFTRSNTMMRMKSMLAVLAAILTLAGTSSAPPKLPDGVKALRDLEYVPGGHERQKLHLFLPEKADGPLPVVVWLHGGAWRAASKNGAPTNLPTPHGSPRRPVCLPPSPPPPSRPPLFGVPHLSPLCTA